MADVDKVHKRNRSTTILKSIVSPRKIPTSPIKDRKQCQTQGSNVLGEITNRNGPLSPKSNDSSCYKDVSEDEYGSPKVKGRSTSIVMPAFFARRKKSQDLKTPTTSHKEKEQENTTPPQSAVPQPYTPIWSQFATSQFSDLGPYPRSETHSRKERENESRSQNILTSPPMAIKSLPKKSREDRRDSKVMNAVAAFNASGVVPAPATQVELQQLNHDFEAVLASTHVISRIVHD